MFSMWQSSWPVRLCSNKTHRYVNVVLTRFQTHSVLPAFSKCLSILPNVHTIQILHAHSAMTTALKDAFRGHTFPSVKTIFLPEQAHEVLRCCPNLRKVVCIQGSGSKLVTAIAKAAKHVEELENFRVDEALVKRTCSILLYLFWCGSMDFIV